MGVFCGDDVGVDIGLRHLGSQRLHAVIGRRSTVRGPVAGLADCPHRHCSLALTGVVADGTGAAENHLGREYGTLPCLRSKEKLLAGSYTV